MFNNGSQGVQSEGWGLTIAEENRSGAGEPGTRKRGKKAKPRKRANCEYCGKEFEVDPKSKGRFCSYDCMYEHNRKQTADWLDCSKCLASIGLGMNTVAPLLGITKSALGRQWRRLGIRALAPDGHVSWRHRASTLGQHGNWWGNKDAAAGWMSQNSARFFDWSCMATEFINKKRAREYQSMMHYTSPKNSNYRLKKIARSRIYNAIKRLGRVDRPRIRYRTEQMVGCSTEHLAAHLESKFKKGMTWDNHGTAWHIDHVIPMAEFDLTDEKQLLLCCHYTNLQPMWARDNLRKSAKMEKDTQMHLRLCAATPG